MSFDQPSARNLWPRFLPVVDHICRHNLPGTKGVVNGSFEDKKCHSRLVYLALQYTHNTKPISHQ